MLYRKTRTTDTYEDTQRSAERKARQSGCHPEPFRLLRAGTYLSEERPHSRPATHDGRVRPHLQGLERTQRDAAAGSDRRSQTFQDPVALGRELLPTGQTYFIRINSLSASSGLGLLTDPPPRGQFIPNPARTLIITNQGGHIALKLELAEPPAGDIMVFGAAPCSAGTYRCFKCLRLGPLPAPDGRLSEITSLYVKRHGVPPVGKRVFVRTRPQNDGPRDCFLELHALVPTRQAGSSQASKA